MTKAQSETAETRLRAYEGLLQPNAAQRAFVCYMFGLRRKCYNYCKAVKDAEYNDWKQMDDASKKKHHWLNAFDFNKLFTLLRHSEFDANGEATDWLKVAEIKIYRNAAKDVVQAFQRFSAGLSAYPRFKKRGKCANTFRSEGVRLEGKRVRLPLLKSGIKCRMKNNIPEGAKIKYATVSCSGNPLDKKTKIYVSFLVEEAYVPKYAQTGKSIGIDLGLKDKVVCSDGTKIRRSRHLKKHERRLKHLQRLFSRKVEFQKKRGAKRIETTGRMARLQRRIRNAHRRVADARRFENDRISNWLVEHYDTIVCENLCIQNMQKNHKLAKSIADVSWGGLLTKIDYKAKWSHKELIRVNPAGTTQTCSACGQKRTTKLTLKEREWTCEHCGTHHDRDVNAAKNILARRDEASPKKKKIRLWKPKTPVEGRTNVDASAPAVPAKQELSHTFECMVYSNG